MVKSDIGMIGLGVMGENLALNIESRGYSVAGYRRDIAKAESFKQEKALYKNITIAHSLKELCQNLTRPRKIIFMVPAGKAVDQNIEDLLPYLDKGDLIIDAGNSHFRDSIRRTAYVESKGLLFIGTGVSGGEEGALKGPAIMPGGSKKAWPLVKDVFTKISAKAPDGVPCCSWIGPDGAGHLVKMVHNGIEYGDMQLICEAFHLMKEALHLSYPEMHEIFAEWNRTELDSYLIEITTDILAKKDDLTGKPIVEIILDRAGQKGTGKWTSQVALDLGVPAPTMAEAVFARCLSALKTERVAASKILPGSKVKFKGDKKKFVKAIFNALYASKICSYAQGFAIMDAASKEYKWNLKLGEIAMLFRAGCIIRARFLESIRKAYVRNPKLPNLLLDPFFKAVITKGQSDWRLVVSTAVNMGIPSTAFSSALTYYDSYRSKQLPANMLQAQRDYFGAHTYERVDRKGSFHTDWLAE